MTPEPNTTSISCRPPEPAVGVGAIVFDASERVLLIRRGKEPAFGLWSIPGGRQEPGETLIQCCRREVLEETGIEIEPGPIVALVERIVSNFHYIIIDFVAVPKDPDGPDPNPATDVSDALWVALTDLNRYPLVEGLERVIRIARESSRSGFAVGLVDADGIGRDFLPNL
ncbi:NUDIX hydrolase [Methylocaldum sp.]|uniref:NUDIX hydrolase n=1 Tax=Methylocaldum sp. TaxID=1969727 RepID=UPI002D45D093|nr:NUDIX hydrolase [Methylocaldum sp.]HYE34998.1 NUDIX hydrolase [Methylocaldum sp.]